MLSCIIFSVVRLFEILKKLYILRAMPYDVICLWHERRTHVVQLLDYPHLPSRTIALVNLQESSDFPTTYIIFCWYFITEREVRTSYSLTFVIIYRRLSSDV